MGHRLNRRGFITAMEGAGALLAASCASGNHASTGAAVAGHGAESVVPKRSFGGAGVMVSQLCFGGASVQGTDGPVLLDEALRLGVDCWEATQFTGRAFGEYFANHPGTREKVFLTAKVKSTDPVVMQRQLDSVLQENATSVIDFLAVHVVRDLAVLTDEVRRWSERVKKQRKIRFFGFCTHKNMAGCLEGAARLGWIDGIQTFYNYRMQGVRSMEDALLACREKGIGIFVVKSMGLGIEDRRERQQLPVSEDAVTARLAAHGLSFEQAKLKAIWSNSNVTSVCSLMPSVAILKSNASAAMDRRPLDQEVRRLLTEYADGASRFFCRRCGACDAAGPDKIPISDLMEMLMYLRGYGNRALAAMAYGRIPLELRNKIPSSDYSSAEEMCPQRIQIAQRMKEVWREFGG